MSATRPEDLHPMFRDAYNAGDLERLLILYELDAVLVAQPGKVASGLAQIKESLQQFLALNGRMGMHPKGIVEGDGVALLVSTWSIKGTGPDGAPIEFRGETADVARRQIDHSWRLAIDNPWGGEL
jgi:uncharacterized protein (TIGR02246 family)